MKGRQYTSNPFGTNIVAKRIEYIDFAKGICMILIIIGHLELSTNIPCFDINALPLYFILSGMLLFKKR